MLSVAYSPDGRRLACGAMDGTVAVFDVPSGKLLHTLTGHHKPVRDLTFTPGARRPPHPGRVCRHAALPAVACSENCMISAKSRTHRGPSQPWEQPDVRVMHLLAEWPLASMQTPNSF